VQIDAAILPVTVSEEIHWVSSFLGTVGTTQRAIDGYVVEEASMSIK